MKRYGKPRAGGGLATDTSPPQNQDLIKQAQTASDEALAIRKELAITFPGVAGRQRDLVAAHIIAGDVFKALNELIKAREQYQQALAVIDNLRSEHPTDSEMSSLGKLRQDLCSKLPDICS